MLKPGFAADVVVLDRDAENAPVDEIEHIMPVLTVCGGRITFEA